MVRLRRMVLIRTTVGSEAVAHDMAKRLVVAGAACVHVAATTSFYVWKGKETQEPEWVVEARTATRHQWRVRAAMEACHPYELPIIESWYVRANGDYAAWAAETDR